MSVEVIEDRWREGMVMRLWGACGRLQINPPAWELVRGLGETALRRLVDAAELVERRVAAIPGHVRPRHAGEIEWIASRVAYVQPSNARWYREDRDRTAEPGFRMPSSLAGLMFEARAMAAEAKAGRSPG